MESIESIIKTMNARPGMFFPNYSIFCIKSFLDGYLFATKNESDLASMYQFQVFITKRFEQISTLSWDKIIRLYCSSDYQAFHRFFELFEQFLEQQSQEEVIDTAEKTYTQETL
ncbi:MAG: hypothetical protein AAF847_03245 [Bacteroidota bacterium]